MNKSYAKLKKKLGVVLASTASRGSRTGRREEGNHDITAARGETDDDLLSDLLSSACNISRRSSNAPKFLDTQQKWDQYAEENELHDMFQSGGTFQGDSFNSLATSARSQRNLMQTSMSSVSLNQRPSTQLELEQNGCRYLQESSYKNAFECYENALEKARQNCVEGHEKVAKFNHLLAGIALKLKRWHQCHQHCREAMEITEALFGKDHYIYKEAHTMAAKASKKIYEDCPKTASDTRGLDCLLMLAESARDEKNFSLAVRHLNDALRDAVYRYGENSLEVACVENALGDNDKFRGNYPCAREHYQKAMSLVLLNGVDEEEPVYTDLFTKMMCIAGLK